MTPTQKPTEHDDLPVPSSASCAIMRPLIIVINSGIAQPQSPINLPHADPSLFLTRAPLQARPAESRSGITLPFSSRRLLHLLIVAPGDRRPASPEKRAPLFRCKVLRGSLAFAASGCGFRCIVSVQCSTVRASGSSISLASCVCSFSQRRRTRRRVFTTDRHTSRALALHANLCKGSRPPIALVPKQPADHRTCSPCSRVQGCTALTANTRPGTIDCS